MRRVLMVSMLAAAATACASMGARGPMQRALDPSIEAVQRAQLYIQSVAGITGDASRLTRSDGFLYVADIAPTLRHLVLTGDSASYRNLRRFVATSMIRRDAAGTQLRRRFRAEAPFEPATPYLVRRLGEALALGWQSFGDTASAALAAGLRSDEATAPVGSATDVLVQRCLAADATVRVDPAVARALLASAKEFRGAELPRPASALDLGGGDGDLVALACLTRLGLGVDDPDATVRFLDRMLDLLAPVLGAGGRPDQGAAADVLQTLRAVRAAGPRYALP